MVAVSKEVPADGDFVLRDVPEGRETDSQYRVNDIGRFLEDLRFEDVAPASSLDFAGSVDKRLEVTTFDGLRVRLDSVMRDGDAWVQLRAEVDEGLVKKTAGADAGTPDAESGTEPSDTSSGALRPLDEVRTEAERMNARWQGWAYELPSFKRDYIAKRMDELTREIEEKDEGTGGGDS